MSTRTDAWANLRGLLRKWTRAPLKPATDGYSAAVVSRQESRLGASLPPDLASWYRTGARRFALAQQVYYRAVAPQDLQRLKGSFVFYRDPKGFHTWGTRGGQVLLDYDAAEYEPKPTHETVADFLLSMAVHELTGHARRLAFPDLYEGSLCLHPRVRGTFTNEPTECRALVAAYPRLPLADPFGHPNYHGDANTLIRLQGEEERVALCLSRTARSHRELLLRLPSQARAH